MEKLAVGSPQAGILFAPVIEERETVPNLIGPDWGCALGQISVHRFGSSGLSTLIYSHTRTAWDEGTVDQPLPPHCFRGL